MKYSPITSIIAAAGLYSAGLIAAENDEKEPEDVEQLMDFKNESKTPRWFALNDGVMGGLSKGSPAVKDGTLFFKGSLSLENNGGFSSIRTSGDYDFGGKEAMVMRVKGDGRTYQLRLATDATYRGSAISYGTEFPTKNGTWTTVEVPFSKLLPGWRGRKLDGPPLNLANIEEIGILIGDKKAGSFGVEIDWIGVK
ncbi:MAG: CIA30 family protein [Akkermansiaceae bacterium]